MKVLTGFATIGMAFALMACGGSTSTGSSTTAEPSAQVEMLKLEKERAEAEAQTAKAEAERGAQEARAASKRAARRAARKAAAQAEARAESAAEAEAEPEEVPNVVGMRLPQAKSALSAAGYTTRAENTDTTFGIVVPSHYTICEQSEPQGNVVTVLAQKYGC